MTFKIAIFGYETWQVAKGPEVAHILPILPRVPSFTPFCSTAGHFQGIGNFAFSQSSRAKNLVIWSVASLYRKMTLNLRMMSLALLTGRES